MCHQITKAIAMNATHGDLFHSHAMHNADGTPTRVRVTGKCKTWKRDARRYRLPFKHGMYVYGAMTDADAGAIPWYCGDGSACDHKENTAGGYLWNVGNLIRRRLESPDAPMYQIVAVRLVYADAKARVETLKAHGYGARVDIGSGAGHHVYVVAVHLS